MRDPYERQLTDSHSTPSANHRRREPENRHLVLPSPDGINEDIDSTPLLLDVIHDFLCTRRRSDVGLERRASIVGLPGEAIVLWSRWKLPPA